VILCRVQAHPFRTALHNRLLPALWPLETQLMLHHSDPPNPWEGYRRCLQEIPEGVSHLLVVQDDCLPAPGFAEAVHKIALRNPDDPVCLFLGAYPAACATRVRRAKPDVRYVPLGPSSYMPLVCVLWPAQAATAFLRWADSARGITRADDANAARWLKVSRRQVLVSVPSIVQHDDDAPSVKGGRDHVPWAEGWRRALLLAEDAAAYDW
jgi:hypothetical protein